MSEHENSTSETANNGPKGTRLALNLSASFLNPGCGDRVRDSGLDEFCGLIWGEVERGFAHENAIDKSKTSIRWEGTFGFQNSRGELGRASSAYLPGIVERDLKKGACPIVRDETEETRPFAGTFSVELWCEKDKPGARRTIAGYSYGVYQRQEGGRPINHLAPPEVRLLLPPEPVHKATLQLLGYDPETGEITEAPQEVEAVEAGEARAAAE